MSLADASDPELLHRYLAHGDEAAARVLVGRYEPIVYAAALRQTGQRDLAEDVTQTVFLVLVRKAAALRGRRSIGGWLVTATRYAAIDALRTQRRRRRHESAAARPDAADAAGAPGSPGDDRWPLLAGVIDAAMARLEARDRDALVLRYFQDRPLAAVATALGVSEDAARKRVGRATERLAAIVHATGVALPATALAALLTANASAAPPAGFAVAIGAAGVAKSAMLVKGTLQMMAMTKLKIAAGVAAALVLGVVGTTVVLQRLPGGSGASGVASGSAPPPLVTASPASAPETVVEAGAEAAALCLRAIDLLTIEGPASSSLDYAGHPPFPAAWWRLAEDADVQNEPARDLVRAARQYPATRWPAKPDRSLPHLNGLRALANDCGDAALLAHARGLDAEAIERIRDVRHVARLVGAPPEERTPLEILVGVGIEALASHRLLVVASAMKLARNEDRGTGGGPGDGAGKDAVAVADAKALIAELLDQRSSAATLDAALAAAPTGAARDEAWKEFRNRADLQQKFRTTVDRVNAERTFAAMSLACHLHRLDHGRWPAQLSELAGAYLPHVPVDPNGDGKQTFGYALIRDGSPGGERPLVYVRPETPGDELFYRTDAPQYGFYGPAGAAAESPAKDGGQFRDVSAWRPADPTSTTPTTRPLGSP
ncbi:MAG TPA: sigma-70 family RNA polymerase sigma factor [Tepidisphaeraceae bacterium]|jgi:RNA polymerase sigma factor (sigma-70 family)